MQINTKIKNISLNLITLIFILTLFLSGLIYFRHTTHRIIKDVNETYIFQQVNSISKAFNIKFDDQLTMLESQARYFEDINFSNSEEMKAIITRTKGIGEFDTIAITNQSGLTITQNGESFLEPSLKMHQKILTTGKPAIAESFIYDNLNKPYLLLAVPVIQNKTVTGIVSGTIEYSKLYKYLIDNESGEKIRSYIVDTDANVIIGHDKRSNIKLIDILHENKNNTVTMEEFTKNKDIILNNKKGLLYYKQNGKSQICAYENLNYNEWYLVAFLDTEFISMQQAQIIKAFFMMIGLLLLGGTILYTIFIYYAKRLDKEKKYFDRVTVANEHYKTIIIDIDFKKDIILFSGETSFLLETKAKKMNLEEFRSNYPRIHPDDENFIQHLLKAFAEKQQKISTEFRLKVPFGDTYSWLKLEGAALYDSTGKLSTFTGTIANVNEQHLHEQQLRKSAEIDSMTGIFNKGYFKKHVEEFLQEKNENTKGAFYIIDLDNFKSTNDTLGHTVGDMAIKDAAYKIARIFSEKDIIGRIGGDEFCAFMCLPEDANKEPIEIMKDKADNLCMILNEFYANDVDAVNITASIGISVLGKDGDNYEDLFHKADIALYSVKNNGKNDYKFYDESMPSLCDYA